MYLIEGRDSRRNFYDRPSRSKCAYGNDVCNAFRKEVSRTVLGKNMPRHLFDVVNKYVDYRKAFSGKLKITTMILARSVILGATLLTVALL